MSNNNKIIKYTVFLLVLGIIAGVLLGAVNSITSPIIQARKQREAKEALEQHFVYPEYSASKIEDGTYINIDRIDDIFYTFDSDGKLASVIYQTVSRGYKSDIKAYVEIKADGKFGKIIMFEHNDTQNYADMLKNHNFGVENKSTDDYSPILAGASYTSQAVIDGIHAAAKHFETIENPGGITK